MSDDKQNSNNRYDFKPAVKEILWILHLFLTFYLTIDKNNYKLVLNINSLSYLVIMGKTD